MPKASSFDFYKLGEVSDKPCDRKEYNVGIVLSDKHETCLKEIYRRMPDEAEQSIAQISQCCI